MRVGLIWPKDNEKNIEECIKTIEKNYENLFVEWIRNVITFFSFFLCTGVKIYLGPGHEFPFAMTRPNNN